MTTKKRKIAKIKIKGTGDGIIIMSWGPTHELLGLLHYAIAALEHKIAMEANEAYALGAKNLERLKKEGANESNQGR